MPLQRQIWTIVCILLLAGLLTEQKKPSKQRKRKENDKHLDKLKTNGSGSEYKTFSPSKMFVGSSQKISDKFYSGKNGIKYEEKRNVKDKKKNEKTKQTRGNKITTRKSTRSTQNDNV